MNTTPDDRRTLRADHEARKVACSCNWSGPCATMLLLDDLEEALARLAAVVKGPV